MWKNTSEITGVPEEKIIQAARLYANTNPAALMHSAAPVVHNTNGVQNYRAVMLLVGLTGNFDVKGGNVVRNLSYLETPAGFDTRVDEYIRPRNRSDMKPRLVLLFTIFRECCHSHLIMVAPFFYEVLSA